MERDEILRRLRRISSYAGPYFPLDAVRPDMRKLHRQGMILIVGANRHEWIGHPRKRGHKVTLTDKGRAYLVRHSKRGTDTLSKQAQRRAERDFHECYAHVPRAWNERSGYFPPPA